MMGTAKSVLKYLLAFFFVAAGINHFWHPDFYLKMMPPYLPWPAALHLLAGLCEIVLGVLLLIPRWQQLAAWGMIALLIAVYPANIYMALNPHLFSGMNPTALWIRLPFQFLFVAWAWWFTRDSVPSTKR
ncbi:MAG: DoxX family protein [Acidobacteriota bacterium]